MLKAATPTNERNARYCLPHSENLKEELAVRILHLAYPAHQHLDTTDRHLQGRATRDTLSHTRAELEAIRIREAQADSVRGA